MQTPLNKYIEESIKQNWDLPALSDYKSITLHYRDVARRIEKLHILFSECGIQKNEKIALAGRNSANWGVTFLAILSYGAVAVPILHEFKPDSIHHIVNHSDAKILFVGDVVWEGLNEIMMPKLDAVIYIPDFSVVFSRKQEITGARHRLNELFGRKYPERFSPNDISYHEDAPDDLALISYTSGTTGLSKGVMLPYRSLKSNLLFAREILPELKPEDAVVSMLPMAHMYGLTYEFLFEIAGGVHINFLTRLPSPKIILDAFADIKPAVIVSVPLIIEKICKTKLLPVLQNFIVKLGLKLPILDHHIKGKIKEKLTEAFGGNFYEVVIGGAALNREAEAMLRDVDFPYAVGYGMTECGPIITFEDWRSAKLYSCGRVASRMQVKISSSDPENIDGEILVKGDNLMLGYYKNAKATAEVIDEDGWLHTGDMGIMDSEGFLFIRGRSKNMILGPSGQNIYPEEIESKLNANIYVSESLVIEDHGKLIALIHPDFPKADEENLTASDLEQHIEELRVEANKVLPQYSQLTMVKLYPEEFEKTPKRSIKRYLYQVTS